MYKAKENLINETFSRMEDLSKRFDHFMWTETSITHIREVNKRLKSLNEFMDMFFELHPGYHEKDS